MTEDKIQEASAQFEQACEAFERAVNDRYTSPIAGAKVTYQVCRSLFDYVQLVRKEMQAKDE